MPRARPNPSEWKAKLWPVFFELAALMKSVETQRRRIKADCDQALSQLPKDATAADRGSPVALLFERLGALNAEVDARMSGIVEKHNGTPYNPVPFSYLHPSEQSPAARADRLTLLLHWKRHGESLEAAYAKDHEADLKAYNRLARTGLDYRLIVQGRSGLKPFKSDEEHSTLLELILAYQKEPLTADERAACFEEYCPCGKRKGHDASALKKQYNRLRLKLGIHPSQRETTPKSEG